MAIYRKIYTGFWTDPVTESLSAEGKFVFLYLLTNPMTTMCGCYGISMHRVSVETGYSIDTVSETMRNLVENGVISYDEGTSEVLITNWGKHNWTKSPKIDKPLAESIEAVKSEKLRGILVEIFQNTRKIPYPYHIGTDAIPYQERTDTVSIPYRNDTDTVSEKDDTVPIPLSVTDSCYLLADSCNEQGNNKGDPSGCDDSDDAFASFAAEALAAYNEESGQQVGWPSERAWSGMRRIFDAGRTVDDVRAVVRKKRDQWESDPRMCRYIRPDTLLGDKFESYLNEPGKEAVPDAAGRFAGVV